MEIVLDGLLMTDRESAHDHLADRLSLPGYYGRNLDALYDLLTDCSEQMDITVIEHIALFSNLGRYGRALLKTLQDAAENNPHLNVSISGEIIENNT